MPVKRHGQVVVCVSMSDLDSSDLAGTPAPSRLDTFAATMSAVLQRCVWSQRMTHASLVPYLIEESYELVDAVETGGRDEIIEELGDVLWQVAFHAAIASHTAGEEFDIQDVAARVTQKMVRRHPHVFGDEVAETPEDVLRVWNAAKSAEKRQRTSILDGIPRSMPALALADKVLGRAENAGLIHPGNGGVPLASEEELGGLLLALVASARARGLDAEGALRGRVRELEAEIRGLEAAGVAD